MPLLRVSTPIPREAFQKEHRARYCFGALLNHSVLRMVFHAGFYPDFTETPEKAYKGPWDVH
jgi:hypothetical protein